MTNRFQRTRYRCSGRRLGPVVLLALIAAIVKIIMMYGW